jgi:hypothetical protein
MNPTSSAATMSAPAFGARALEHGFARFSILCPVEAGSTNEGGDKSQALQTPARLLNRQ